MENEICSIRAGRLLLSGGQLNADARKGLLRLAETEDTLVHVQWFERTATGRADAPEEDTIVFPGEAVLEKIPGQRAVVLKFPEDKSRNVFYWIQEPRGTEAADDQRIAAFNAGINRTPDAGVDAAAVAPVSGVAPSSALEHAHVASEAGAGAMLDLAGGAVGQLPAAPAQTPASTASVNAQATHLASILGNAIAAGLGGGSRPAYGSEEQLANSLLAQLAQMQAQQGGRRMAVAPGPSLAEVLRPEALLPVLREPGVLQVLAPHLPEEHRTTEALLSLAHSPQFQQQLHTFSAALQSGQLDLSQFGLRAAGFSVADFLSAIQDLVAREQQQQQGQGQGQGGQGGQGGSSAPMEQ